MNRNSELYFYVVATLYVLDLLQLTPHIIFTLTIFWIHGMCDNVCVCVCVYSGCHCGIYMSG